MENAANKTYAVLLFVTLTINKEGTDGEAVSLSSLIVSILDYYNTHDYYNYGGVDYIKEDADSWTVGLYANRPIIRCSFMFRRTVLLEMQCFTG